MALARTLVLGNKMGNSARMKARKTIRRHRITKHLRAVLPNFDPESWFDEPSEDDIMFGFESEENMQLKKIAELENVMKNAWKARQGDPFAELFGMWPIGEDGSEGLMERMLADLLGSLSVNDGGGSGSAAAVGGGMGGMFQFNAGQARPMQPVKRQRTLEGWVRKT